MQSLLKGDVLAHQSRFLPVYCLVVRFFLFRGPDFTRPQGSKQDKSRPRVERRIPRIQFGETNGSKLQAG